MELSYDDMCFACGKSNPIGLKLEFEEDGNVYRTTFVPQKEHQGYEDILHGGIMSTLLDEVMGRYLFIKNIAALTVELNIRLKKAAKTGDKLVVDGWITSDRGRLIEMEAKAVLEDGTIVAEATGKFIKIKK